jgi:hypothetical protein
MSLRERLSATEEARPLAVVLPEVATRAYQELKVLEQLHHATTFAPLLSGLLSFDAYQDAASRLQLR